MHPKQRSPSLQMAGKSSLGVIDHRLGTGAARVSDVDHNQVTLAWLSKCLLHRGADLT